MDLLPTPEESPETGSEGVDGQDRDSMRIETWPPLNVEQVLRSVNLKDQLIEIAIIDYRSH
jgi:hypothetical protein